MLMYWMKFCRAPEGDGGGGGSGGDIGGGAPASPGGDGAASPAPSAEPSPSLASSEPVAPPAPVADKSIRGALDRAFAAETPDDVTVPKGMQRDLATGQFVAKIAADPATVATPLAKPGDKTAATPTAADEFREPPPRLSAEAKAAWRETPLAIRADVSRAVREMEQGIAKYKPDAESYAPLKPYADLAGKNGTTVKAALDNYLNLSRGLNNADPQVRLKTMEHIAGIAGMNLRDIAASIMGQKPDQVASAQEATIRDLRGKLASLEKRLDTDLGEVKTRFQKQTEAEADRALSDFVGAKDAAGAALHPRFEELGKDIAQQIELGYDLEQAYKRAELLNPAPVAATPAQVGSDPTKKPAVAQPDKGSLSPSGAPSSGSDPTKRKPPSTAREALERAAVSLNV